MPELEVEMGKATIGSTVPDFKGRSWQETKIWKLSLYVVFEAMEFAKVENIETGSKKQAARKLH